MLNMNNEKDKAKMMNYYRTSEMLNLSYFFPELSPITDLVIVETTEDYLNNKDYYESFDQNRFDTLKGRPPLIGVENAGKKNSFYNGLVRAKEIDENGVIVLFNINSVPTERYERLAGISVRVEIGDGVYIDAVSKGFDGREVSKSICTHERYYIPWYKLRSLNIENFRDYQTFLIDNEEYQITRRERIEFLKSLGLDSDIVSKYIPEKYEMIPDKVWAYVIKELLKKLEKNEEILSSYGFKSFAISGHTEGDKFAPWSMFDKSRYTSINN